MALLEKLKSLFGVGGDGSTGRDRSVTVDSESTRRTGREAPPPMSSRDRDEPADETDPSSADAVDESSGTDGTPTGDTDEGETTDTADEADEPTTGDRDRHPAADESETATDAIDEAEPKTGTEPVIEEAEAAEADGTEDEGAAAGTDAGASTGTISRVPDEDGAAEPSEAVSPDETDAAPTTEKTADSDPEPTEVESEPVTEIKGIGPAYGDRLADAGVDSILALAESDAAALAEETDIAASRIEEWIDRANDR